MSDADQDSAIKSADALLKNYGFDAGEISADFLLDRWLRQYQAKWVRLALIESLYQGRYKAVSVEQILVHWARRGQPIYHFNNDFEALICTNLPQNLSPKREQTSPPAKTKGTQTGATQRSPATSRSLTTFPLSDADEHASDPDSQSSAIEFSKRTAENSAPWSAELSYTNPTVEAQPPQTELFPPDLSSSSLINKLRGIVHTYQNPNAQTERPLI